MTHHINEFTVHDYKGIHELTLKDIASINILTGDNNSGKTSLLELIATTEDPSSLWNWRSALRINNISFFRCRSYFEGFCNLFPFEQAEGKKVEYEWLDQDKKKFQWQMNGTVINKQILESEIDKNRHHVNLEGEKKVNRKNEDVLLDSQEIKLIFSCNGSHIEDSKTVFDRQNYISDDRPSYQNNEIIFVSPFVYITHDYLNNTLTNPDAYVQLIYMLKFFDPHIIGLNAIKSDYSPNIVNYQILSNNHKHSLPLSEYGDGMKMAIHFLSALIQAQNGILLIDEFETGIHTSCMDQVFSLLLENALKLNVQVFMTSHSKEAISKVLRLSPDIQEKLALYTLYKYKGKNYARRVDCQKAIKMQEELGMELR